MKNHLFIFLFLSTFSLMAQNLDSTWVEIDQSIADGKLKSMQPKVQSAIALAREKGNIALLAKGLFIDGQITVAISDEKDDINHVFNSFKREGNLHTGATKSLFQVYLAGLYKTYYDENKWRIRNRTALDNTASDDVRFWTMPDFVKRITSLYDSALLQKDVLLNEKITDWVNVLEINTSEITNDEKKSLELTPTLYDVFTQMYGSFLEEEKQFKASLYQDLASYNLANKNIAAYLYNEHKILSAQKDNEYLKQLEALAGKFPENRYNQQIYTELAREYYRLGGEKKDATAYKKVFDIFETVSRLFPNSDATSSISSIINNIKTSEFSVESEEYIPSKKNTPIKISHRNIDRVYVRVLDYNVGVKDVNSRNISSQLSQYQKDSESRYYSFLNAHKTVQEYAIDLKKFDDFLHHSSIFNLKPLPQGRFVIVLSDNPNFKYNTDNLKYLEIRVSNLAVGYDGKSTFSVRDRITGVPTPNKTIEIYKEGYNSKTNNYYYSFIKSVKSDANGEAEFSDERRFLYRLSGENVIYGENLYRYDSSKPYTGRDFNTQIFTDRAIYRPGQTVYFKGIVTRSKEMDIRVAANRNVSFWLSDVNGKELQRLSLKTNEFGSVNGEFILPASVLTGNFSINSSENGYYSLKVEEYKRPKFKVDLEKPLAVYQLKDSVSIKGVAMAFSGANLDRAKVEYRVYRQAIFPFRYWGGGRTEPEEQMTYGSTETNNNGEFTFSFIALPAREQKDKNDIRTYTYRVEASVTDLNGETQTGTQSVTIGDRRILLSANLASEENVESLKSFTVKVTNLNLQPLENGGELKIVALNSPDRVLRESRYTTDYNYYSKSEFINLFPNEPYGNETKPEDFDRGQTVFFITFDKEREIKVPQFDKIKEGYYLIVLTPKYEPFTVENTQLIYLKNEKKTENFREIFSFEQNQKVFQPGDIARITLKSATDLLYVQVKVEGNGALIFEKNIKLRKKPYVIEIPILEEHRGGLYFHYTWTKYNSSLPGTERISIPFDNKKLKITTSVNRDKLNPGATQKWSFKVTGQDKDKLLAEVLTGMYDASLDQFASNSFNYFAYNFYSTPFHAFSGMNYDFGQTNSRNIRFNSSSIYYGKTYHYSPLNTYGFSFSNAIRIRGLRSELEGRSVGLSLENSGALLDEVVVSGYGGKEAVQSRVVAASKMEVAQEKSPPPASQEVAAGVAQDTIPTEETNTTLNNVQARKALQETAFFYPNLRTDKDGNVSFEFTVPESLTEWKLMAFAHTPDMKTGYYETRVKTQKDLMVVPNVPRFLREGDELRISTKIVNLSEQSLNGTARLVLTDAISGNEVNSLFANTNTDRAFTTAKGESGEVSWTIKVPKNIQAVSYKIVAAAGDFSDGEESILPVVTNRMLVTETLPISIRENQNKTFTLEKLTKNTSETLDNFKLTFEMTTNPLWYAIFSLPYLREYPYECSEQVFSRLYGNLISENIISSQPKIKAVFEDWNRKGQLKSKLELNQELKNILLEETPWVRDAVSEEEQMKRIAVLFDLNKMQQEMKTAFDKLSQKQQSSGGFAWFDGGRENEYITTHIVSGFGNLKNMKIDFKKHEIELNNLVRNAINFIDQKQLAYYKEQQRLKKNELDWNTGIHYLYARSFFLQEHAMPKTLDSLKFIYLSNIKKNAKDFSLQTQAMAALVLSRFGEQSAAEKLLKTVNEHSVDSDEMGKYWKSNLSGWYWYQAPVETQALLIEAFHEVLKDETSVEAMKVWLLKNRQTNQWNSTKATTKAVYVLMNTGKSWIDAEKGVNVKIGGQNIDLNTPSAQAGSGYVKMAWNKDEIKPEMGKIEVQKTSPGVAWGAMYWQYFEDLDKITSAETGVKFNKKLYLKKNSPTGPILREITATTPIEIGDLVTVRLEISIDRNMEFVHIKDMRASGFEPVNVLSGYKWKDGFGYYESTRDLATNFFADYMRKGTYVFEYDLRANNAGKFSNGITQMQNMYAPELSAHSKGIRVDIRD